MFKLIEIIKTDTLTMPGARDNYMGTQEDDYKSMVTRHYYLAVPAQWYLNNAFDEAVKEEIYGTLFGDRLRNLYSANPGYKSVRTDIDTHQSDPNVIDAAKWENHFYIFQPDRSCRYVSLAEFKDFMRHVTFVNCRDEQVVYEPNEALASAQEPDQ